jgi:hypothetical protein
MCLQLVVVVVVETMPVVVEPVVRLLTVSTQ